MNGNVNEYNLRQELLERRIIDVILGNDGLILKLDNNKRLLIQRECDSRDDHGECELIVKLIY